MTLPNKWKREYNTKSGVFKKYHRLKFTIIIQEPDASDTYNILLYYEKDLIGMHQAESKKEAYRFVRDFMRKYP